MSKPAPDRHEIQRFARGAGDGWIGVRITAAIFLFIGGWTGILGLVIYVASHHPADTQAQSTIEQAIFFLSAACAITGAVFFILDWIVLRVWLAISGIGLIAMIASGYIWKSYFGWYDWGGTFQSGPFLKQTVVPGLLMGAIVALCAQITQRVGLRKTGSGSGK